MDLRFLAQQDDVNCYFWRAGNEALAHKEYDKAIEYFTLAKEAMPSMTQLIEANIQLAKHRQKKPTFYAAPVQTESIDIVVPVYNALEDVKNCLASLEEHTDGFQVRIFVINDASEAETTEWLRELCKNKPLFTLMENPENLGYTKTVNIGLRASTADYVITQNSDTIVTKGWLRGMVRCMKSDANIGIVGPLGNAAGWQSVPEVKDRDKGGFAVNELPEGVSLPQMAEVISSISEKEYPRIPLINGFCFMIRRSVIEAIGYMDEENFPIGYGEENDYCIRAAEAGFELAVVDDVYVWHEKSKSFKEKRIELINRGLFALFDKYTNEKYITIVNLCRRNSSLISAQLKIITAINIFKTRNVEHLFKCLYSGYHDYAQQKLNNILSKEIPSSKNYNTILKKIINFNYATNNLEYVLDLIHKIKEINNDENIYFLEILTLFKLKRFNDAEIAYKKLPTKIQETAAGLFLFSRIVRHIDINASSSEKNKLSLLYINKALKKFNLCEISLINKHNPLNFDNIHCPNLPPLPHAPYKISVIMPVYNRAQTIAYAVKSVLAQTWNNLEIIIVDDASTDSTEQVVKSLIQLDHRVTYIRNKKNIGCYPSRNRALILASGDFITVHDSDDWSHPQRFALQMKHFENNKELKANYTLGIYCTKNFLVEGWYAGVPIIKMAMVSSIFRKEIFEELGNWQQARQSADTEFIARIRKHYGKNAYKQIEGKGSLYFFYNSEDSLTRKTETSQLTNFFISGTRWLYNSYVTHMHNSVPSSNYSAKKINIPSCISEAKLSYDIIFVADFTREKTNEIFSHIKKSLNENITIAIYHMAKHDSSLNMLPSHVFSETQKHDIDILAFSDKVKTKNLIFYDMLDFSVFPHEFVKVETEKIFSVCDNPTFTHKTGQSQLDTFIQPLLRKEQSIHHVKTFPVIFNSNSFK